MVLRWKVGPREYVEALEHRVVHGVVTTAEHVHHRNQNRADNDPCNLSPPARKIDPEEVRRLYDTGLAALAIARTLGCSRSPVETVMRELRLPPRRPGRPPSPRPQPTTNQENP